MTLSWKLMTSLAVEVNELCLQPADLAPECCQLLLEGICGLPALFL